jgi:hypothetical protein
MSRLRRRRGLRGGAAGEVSREGSRRPSGRAGSLALAAAATLGSLLLLEAGSRLLLDPPRYHDQPLEFHPVLGFRGVPGFRREAEDELGPFTFQLNAQGLRGREIPPPSTPARPGVSRIAFVGDSFLVGQALREEHLVTARTAAALRERGREVEVYNLSAIDWGTGQQILALRRLGRGLAPEAVVLFVYPGNDIVNNSMLLAGRTRASAGDYLRPYLVPEPGGWRIRYLDPFRARLRRHSRLFATLESRVLAVGAERGIRWLQPWPPPIPPAVRLAGGRAPREELEVFRHRDDPGDAWERAWSRSFELLRAFREECDSIGARLLVVVIPSVHQVLRTPKGIRLDLETRILRGLRVDNLLDWNLPENRLAHFFEREGIAAHMLLPALREAAESGATVYTRDEHLGWGGHQVAARPVVAWLLDEEQGPEGEKISGAPVPALPEASEAPSLLDFREQSHVAHLGDGWLRSSSSRSPMATWWCGVWCCREPNSRSAARCGSWEGRRTRFTWSRSAPSRSGPPGAHRWGR